MNQIRITNGIIHDSKPNTQIFTSSSCVTKLRLSIMLGVKTGKRSWHQAFFPLTSAV